VTCIPTGSNWQVRATRTRDIGLLGDLAGLCTARTLSERFGFGCDGWPVGYDASLRARGTARASVVAVGETGLIGFSDVTEEVRHTGELCWALTVLVADAWQSIGVGTALAVAAAQAAPGPLLVEVPFTNVRALRLVQRNFSPVRLLHSAHGRGTFQLTA
jgi:GNAT superfamily N-acetyltransferase